MATSNTIATMTAVVTAIVPPRKGHSEGQLLQVTIARPGGRETVLMIGSTDKSHCFQIGDRLEVLFRRADDT